MIPAIVSTFARQFEERERGESPLFFVPHLFEMINIGTVRKAVEEKIDGTGMFIVDVAVKSGDKVFVEVDKDPAVSISELAGLNRYLERYFEEEADNFEMRVSSPGLDRPLRHAKQFTKNIGRDVKVILNDGRVFEGELVGQEGGELVLIIRKKVKGKKELEKSTMEFKVDEIKETRLLVKIK